MSISKCQSRAILEISWFFSVLVATGARSDIVRTRMNSPTASAGNTWLAYTMLTVFSWGVYGILLHKGQVFMGDPINGRYKAFLFVGIAYFLTAVLAPLVLLMSRNAAFSGYTSSGAWWSLIAGIAGAIGAFGVLLAFGAKGSPAVVMAIVFGGAPVINAGVALYLARNETDFSKVNPLFYLGLVLALVGGGLVTRYKPNPIPKKGPAAQVAPATVAPRPTA
jgi:drug/metabolite transporter (DMT)-like permease